MNTDATHSGLKNIALHTNMTIQLGVVVANVWRYIFFVLVFIQHCFRNEACVLSDEVVQLIVVSVISSHGILDTYHLEIAVAYAWSAWSQLLWILVTVSHCIIPLETTMKD